MNTYQKEAFRDLLEAGQFLEANYFINDHYTGTEEDKKYCEKTLIQLDQSYGDHFYGDRPDKGPEARKQALAKLPTLCRTLLKFSGIDNPECLLLPPLDY